MKMKIVLVVLLFTAVITGCTPKKGTAVGEGVYGIIEINYDITNNYISDKVTFRYTGEDELIAVNFQADNPVLFGASGHSEGQLKNIGNQTASIEGKKKNEFDNKEDIINEINQGNITVEWETTDGVHEEIIHLSAKY